MADDDPPLTPQQAEALNALPARRRAFVLAYCGPAGGNATDAARRAGYAKPHPEGAQLLRNPTVRAAVDALRSPVEREAIAGIEELRALWTAVARGPLPGLELRDAAARDVMASIAVRLRASELLARSLGAFLDRHEVRDVTAHAFTAPRSRAAAIERLEAVLARVKGSRG